MSRVEYIMAAITFFTHSTLRLATQLSVSSPSCKVVVISRLGKGIKKKKKKKVSGMKTCRA